MSFPKLSLSDPLDKPLCPTKGEPQPFRYTRGFLDIAISSVRNTDVNSRADKDGSALKYLVPRRSGATTAAISLCVYLSLRLNRSKIVFVTNHDRRELEEELGMNLGRMGFALGSVKRTSEGNFISCGEGDILVIDAGVSEIGYFVNAESPKPRCIFCFAASEEDVRGPRAVDIKSQVFIHKDV